MGSVKAYRHRSLAERLKLYSRVRELQAAGLRPSEIGREMGMCREDVRYWLRVDQPSRNVYAPDLNPRPELAYLAGAYLGDGQTAGPQDKKVRFKLADAAFAGMLNERVARILGAETKSIRMERGFHCVSYDSAVLYDYLQQPLEALQPLIDSSPAMFLRGFFDAEGHVSPRLDYSTRKFLGASLGVTNTNPDYLSCVQQLLEKLGIKSSNFRTHEVGEPMTIRGRTFIRKHEVRHLQLRGQNHAETFQARIDFSIPAKKQKLADFIWISKSLTMTDGYAWFVSHYELRNRRWIRDIHADTNL
ncbi:MAG: hypothetical protein OK449_02435 [Thaumarchaeota archaeon]|nr:hypothetical protein [Nitrososphaerota archaeon]